jgi:hypothetical protein
LKKEYSENKQQNTSDLNNFLERFPLANGLQLSFFLLDLQPPKHMYDPTKRENYTLDIWDILNSIFNIALEPERS